MSLDLTVKQANQFQTTFFSFSTLKHQQRFVVDDQSRLSASSDVALLIIINANEIIEYSPQLSHVQSLKKTIVLGILWAFSRWTLTPSWWRRRQCWGNWGIESSVGMQMDLEVKSMDFFSRWPLKGGEEKISSRSLDEKEMNLERWADRISWTHISWCSISFLFLLKFSSCTIRHHDGQQFGGGGPFRFATTPYVSRTYYKMEEENRIF